MEETMDFEAELDKFQPSLDIEQAEDAIYGNSTGDMMDLLELILEDDHSQNTHQTRTNE